MESGTDLYQRVPTVVLRPEAFGGMAFRGRSGTTLELDEEAYRLLVLLNQPLTVDEAARSLGVSDCVALESLVQEFLALGFLQVFRVPSSNLQVPTWNLKLGTWNREHGTTALPIDHLSAPESIHLALTHRCNLTCPCCYVGHDAAPEMTTAQVQALIDQAATGRVFQLALGGGEPLLRDDLIEIVAYAWQRGLVPNVTTNGTLLTPALIRELAPYVGQVQLSLNGPDAVTHERYRAHGSFRPAVEAMHLLQEGGVPFGVNTLVTRDNLPRLQQTIALAVERGARQITVLRPKPAPDAAWLPQVSPTPQEYRWLHSLLARAQLAYPQVLFTVDCALSFLMSDIAPARLRRGAVNGCAGGVRFLTVLPNGDAYPCSFLTSAGMRAGNLLTQGLDEVWHRAHVLVRWRQMDSRLQGHCRHCPTQAHCQGCRAIALTATGHLWAADPDCPRCQEGDDNENP